MYSKVIEFYLKKINSTASFSEVKLIDSYIDEMEEDLIIEAMNITIKIIKLIQDMLQGI